MAIARSLVVDIAMNTASIRQDITQAKQQFSSLERNIRKVTVAAAKVAGAFYAMRGAFDLAESAAKFDQAEQAFANLAASHGANSQKIIDGLDKMAAGTVSTANIMASAGKAMLLGIPADKLEELMSVARASARITGQSVQQAFDDISTGLGRQSKLILDNLGIIVDAGKAYDVYAKSIGKTASQLTDAEKKQAFINAALKSGNEIVKRVGVTTLTAAEAMNKFNAQIENAKIFLGKTIIAITAFVSAVALGISTMVHMVIAGVADMIASMTEVIAKAPLIGDKFEGAAKGLRTFADAEKFAANDAAKMASAQIDIANAIFKRKEAMDSVTKSAPATAAESIDTKKMQTELDAVRQQLLDEETLIAESWFKRQGILEDALNNQLLTKQAYSSYSEELERQSIDRLAEVRKKEADRATQIEANKSQQIISMSSQVAAAAMGFMEATGKKQSAVGQIILAAQKALGVAQAIINTNVAVTAALALGPPGWAMIPWIKAAGYTSAALIGATALAGGGGGAGGGGSAPTPQPGPDLSSPGFASSQPGVTSPNQSSQNVTVNIQNGMGSKDYWQSLVDEVIVPGINDAQKRNVNIVVREF